MDVAAIWRTYGRHAAIVLRAGPGLTTTTTAGSFTAFSGAPHVDLNQAALFGPATAADATAIVDAAAGRDIPVLLALSSAVHDPDPIRALLDAAGFLRTARPEMFFHARRPPPVAPSPFTTRRVTTSADHVALLAVFDAAHDYKDEATRRMYGPALLDGPDVEAWLAWDGDEPISCVYVTRVGDDLGVFDMNTAPAHRRRGAGRAVLTAALQAIAGRLDRPPSVSFWSSPLGRPMYEALGFAGIDDVEAWTLGASAQDLEAVGAG